MLYGKDTQFWFKEYKFEYSNHRVPQSNAQDQGGNPTGRKNYKVKMKKKQLSVLVLMVNLMSCISSKTNINIVFAYDNYNSVMEVNEQYFLVHNFDFRESTYDSLIAYCNRLKFDLDNDFSASFFNFSQTLEILYSNKNYEIDLDSHGEDCVFIFYYSKQLEEYSYSMYKNDSLFKSISIPIK